MSMGLPYGSGFHFSDFRNIFFVVDAIAQNVAKVPECTLQGISCPFFLSFLKSSSFSLAIFDVSVSDILAGLSIDFDSLMKEKFGTYLMISPIFQRDPDYDR